MKFYNKNLHVFFPTAKNIITLNIRHPEALSETSYLTRAELEVINFKKKREIYHIRGNVVSSQTNKILKFVYTHNQAGLISPRPLFYFNNVHYILYEETPGTRLREFNFKSPDFPLFIKKIAVTLAKIHNLPPPSVSKTKGDEPALFADLKAKIKSFNSKNYSLFKKYLQQYLILSKNKLRKNHLVLSHNDFQASNIIITPKNEIAIIDYTMSSLFYPAYDLANFITHLEIMLDRIMNRQKINKLQHIFYQNYLKNIKKALVKEAKAAFPLMRVRSALDIWAITVTLMGPKDKNRRRYVNKLKNIIEENLNKN